MDGDRRAAEGSSTMSAHTALSAGIIGFELTDSQRRIGSLELERGRDTCKTTFRDDGLMAGDPSPPGGGVSRRSASVPSRSATAAVSLARRLADERKYKTQNEMRLIGLVVGLLEDANMNPYKGSVPVERIQNVIRAQHGPLYTLIVGSRHNSWKRFLEFHPRTFHLFCVDDGKWRMRLVRHCDWREADLQEQEERHTRDSHLIGCLATFLRTQPNGHCRVDDFRNAYPSLPQNRTPDGGKEPPYPLPARGDLTRFVRRHPARFIYDKDNFSIILRPPAGEDPRL
jgi:hypothetical protein